MYLCTSKASKASKLSSASLTAPALMTRWCQYLYLFCTTSERSTNSSGRALNKKKKALPQRDISICTFVPSNASKLGVPISSCSRTAASSSPRRCHYLYFCTSKASKMSTTLHLALARCRVVLSALHQLLHYSTQFTCFTGTKVQTLTSRAAESSSPRCTSSLLLTLLLLSR